MMSTNAGVLAAIHISKCVRAVDRSRTAQVITTFGAWRRKKVSL